MNAHVQHCLITGYEFLIPTLELPDSGDRHVLAAAIHGGAELILTFNQKDFPEDLLSPYGIRAVSPDDFVRRQLEHAPGQVCLAATRHRQSLRNPPKDPWQYLDTLANQGLAQIADKLRELIDAI
ncbi:MAG: hypothetical protein WDZ51_11355 [Pirellulaceae bacterium]